MGWCAVKKLLTHSLLHCLPFSWMRRTWWDGIKQHLWRERVKGESANPGSPAVKLACNWVPICMYFVLCHCAGLTWLTGSFTPFLQCGRAWWIIQMMSKNLFQSFSISLNFFWTPMVTNSLTYSNDLSSHSHPVQQHRRRPFCVGIWQMNLESPCSIVLSHRTIVGQSCNNCPRLFLADSLSDGMTLSADHFQAELDTILCHWWRFL